jgi:hypothetical protein
MNNSHPNIDRSSFIVHRSSFHVPIGFERNPQAFQNAEGIAVRGFPYDS